MNRLNEDDCDCHIKVIKDLQEELEERNASIRAILELTGFDEASDPVEAVRLKLETAKDQIKSMAGQDPYLSELSAQKYFEKP